MVKCQQHVSYNWSVIDRKVQYFEGKNIAEVLIQ